MITIWILGDQLTHHHSAIPTAQKSRDAILMIESKAWAVSLNHHQIKLAMIFSAMRHFASELRSRGWQVDYYEMAENYESALRHHLQKFPSTSLLMMSPNSWQEQKKTSQLSKKLGFNLQFTPPVQFLCTREEFKNWAHGRNRLLMETHYRQMRQRLGLLIEKDGSPTGGRWNFDAENRLNVRDYRKDGSPQPAPYPNFKHDKITSVAVSDIKKNFPHSPGDASNLWLPVTREQALICLQHFIENHLALFGKYEDLMISSHGQLFHSLLSAPINLGLLTPLECAQAAENALHKGLAPLSAVEGFIRQIIGWREFINGIYWLKMPDYLSVNALNAHRQLPDFFSNGKTDMRCLSSTIQQVHATGYNHHIQRLMILGNFLLLAGINPALALRWFNQMYVDAFDWVMAANLLGMALHADGGFMATKPYAASASYISKMSDYCKGCAYSPTTKIGPGACPFNFLYWHFFDRHSQRFSKNPRTAVIVQSWLKKTEFEKSAYREQALTFLNKIAPEIQKTLPSTEVSTPQEN